MKPCEFPGWVELEPDDMMVSGDPMTNLAGKTYQNHPENPLTFVHGYHGYPASRAKGYRVFRASPLAEAVKAKRILNAHFSKPLPLP